MDFKLSGLPEKEEPGLATPFGRTAVRLACIAPPYETRSRSHQRTWEHVRSTTEHSVTGGYNVSYGTVSIYK